MMEQLSDTQLLILNYCLSTVLGDGDFSETQEGKDLEKEANDLITKTRKEMDKRNIDCWDGDKLFDYDYGAWVDH